MDGGGGPRIDGRDMEIDRWQIGLCYWREGGGSRNVGGGVVRGDTTDPNTDREQMDQNGNSVALQTHSIALPHYPLITTIYDRYARPDRRRRYSLLIFADGSAE